MADPTSEDARPTPPERVEARVEPAPPPAPRAPAMAAKDWLSIGLSAIALVTSAGTAYFTNIRQTDILRLEVNSSPVLSMDRTSGRLSIKGDLRFFLINAGTRPAVVSGLHLDIGEPDKDGKCAGTRFDAELEAFVVGSQDIVAKQAHFKPSKSENDVLTEGDEMTFPPRSLVAGKSSGAMCVSAEITTPSHTGETRGVSLVTYSFEKEHGGSISRIIRSIPATIWRETTSILGD
jgi:hypothetical protein